MLLIFVHRFSLYNFTNNVKSKYFVLDVIGSIQYRIISFSNSNNFNSSYFHIFLLPCDYNLEHNNKQD